MRLGTILTFQHDSNSNCMSISVNGKNIQVFTDGETYLGTNNIDREHEQKLNERTQSDRPITPEQITRDTISTGVGIEETNAVINEIRQTQTKDKQQGIEI